MKAGTAKQKQEERLSRGSIPRLAFPHKRILNTLKGGFDMSKTELIEKMRKDGYPYRIKGNGGYKAVLYDIQPLNYGDYCAIYRYPGGVCCHGLEEIKACFEVIEQ